MTATLEVPTFKGGKNKAKIPVPKLGEMPDPKARAAAGFGCFRIMTEEDGDKRYTWDRNSFEEIREAKAFFDKCVAEGLVAHRVGVDGKKTAEIMVEFDPLAEEIIFVPVQLVVGG